LTDCFIVVYCTNTSGMTLKSCDNISYKNIVLFSHYVYTLQNITTTTVSQTTPMIASGDTYRCQHSPGHFMSTLLTLFTVIALFLILPLLSLPVSLQHTPYLYWNPTDAIQSKHLKVSIKRIQSPPFQPSIIWPHCIALPSRCHT